MAARHLSSVLEIDDQALQELGGGLVWDQIKPLPEWERENVGITQAEAGAQLLQKWQFPSAVVAAVGAQDAAYPTLARSREPLVYGMHCMSEMLPAGKGVAALQTEEEAPLSFPENHPFVTTHRLTPEMISDVCNESRRGFDSIRQTLYS